MDTLPMMLNGMTIEPNKKKYNAMESVLQKIQKASSLSNSEKSAHNSILHEILEKLISNMAQADPLFKLLYNKNLYGGSYYDGLKLHSPDEYDVDLVLKFPKKMKVKLITSEVPGFVQIHINLDSMKDETNYSDYSKMDKFLNSENYLLTNKFRDWFEGVFNKGKNIYQANSQRKFELQTSRSGPAMTLKIKIDGKVVSVDLVPSIIFGQSDWPKPPFRENTSKKFQDFLVVPKDPKSFKTKKSSYSFWRLSFQQQESEIILGKCGLKDTIRLLKLLRNRQFQETSIASYFIKTVMMLFSESVDETYWNNSRSYIFMMGLKYFGELLSKHKKISYYWDKRYNLLDGTNDVTLTNWGNRVKAIFKNIEKELSSPDLEAKILDHFGQTNLKDKTKENGRKDIENGTEYPGILRADNDGEGENISKNPKKEAHEINEPPSRKNEISLLATTPSCSSAGIPEDGSVPRNLKNTPDSSPPSRKNGINLLARTPSCSSEGIPEDCSVPRKLKSNQDSSLPICRTLTEYESVGINVTKKLERMNETQANYAEKLIIEILIKGLNNELSIETNICNNNSFIRESSFEYI